MIRVAFAKEFLITFVAEYCRSDKVQTITFHTLALKELNTISSSNQLAPVAARSTA